MKNYNTIIDVRTPGEYITGNAKGSVNIPLHEIPTSIPKIKSMQQPMVLCCASGNRSGQATSYLRQLGVDCDNGGSWQDVNSLMNKN